MARQPRFMLPGHPQHIIQRGINRQAIFRSDRDYRFYLDKLEEKSVEHQLHIHSYVLMPNHTHILATPWTEDSISKVLQSLGRSYAQHYNHIHERSGALFEGRYRSTIVDSATYLFDCYRYIESNPVRAGIVKHPSEYFWSSYRCNALGVGNNLITPHKKYLSLEQAGYPSFRRYNRLFDTPLDDRLIEEITEATNKSWVLGSKDFKDTIEQLLNRRSSPKPRGGDRKSTKWNVKRA